ncbi:MAG: YkgJ family cysteine cluster protein [Geobacteraceae bacterium]
MNPALEPIVEKYGQLLKGVDQWFARSATAAGNAVQCGKGCSSCCRGLFDITLLDAFYLRQGIDSLAPRLREVIHARIASQVQTLQLIWPDIAPPYILNVLPEETLDRLMPEADETPCPLLGDGGLCLVYEYRPMTCRLHGISLVDISGEFFQDEWCTNNFKDENPLERQDLRWGFRELFQEELVIFQEFTSTLLNQRINELDTLIPLAALIDFDGLDWKRWWEVSEDTIRNAGFPENLQNIPSPD